MSTDHTLLSTTDAQVWAQEWCRIARLIQDGDGGGSVIDEGWMIGWFANALETGRAQGRKEMCPHTNTTDLSDDLRACMDCGTLNPHPAPEDLWSLQ